MSQNSNTPDLCSMSCFLMTRNYFRTWESKNQFSHLQWESRRAYGYTKWNIGTILNYIPIILLCLFFLWFNKKLQNIGERFQRRHGAWITQLFIYLFIRTFLKKEKFVKTYFSLWLTVFLEFIKKYLVCCFIQEFSSCWALKELCF